MIEMSITQGAFTINGHLVSGWSDSSDCLAFPDSVEFSAFKKGATGTMISTATGERGGPVTIKVLPNSPTAAFFAKLIKQKENGIPVQFEATWVNPVAGEFITCSGGTMVSGPKGTTYGKGEVGEKVYVFEFEDITETPETSLLASAVSAASVVTAAL